MYVPQEVSDTYFIFNYSSLSVEWLAKVLQSTMKSSYKIAPWNDDFLNFTIGLSLASGISKRNIVE